MFALRMPAGGGTCFGGGAWFTSEDVVAARCPLLGYALRAIMVEGQTIGNWFLRVDKQPEVGEEAYDRGAGMTHEKVQEYCGVAERNTRR